MEQVEINNMTVNRGVNNGSEEWTEITPRLLIGYPEFDTGRREYDEPSLQ